MRLDGVFYKFQKKFINEMKMAGNEFYDINNYNYSRQ